MKQTAPIRIPDPESIRKQEHWIASEIKRIGMDRISLLARQASYVRSHAYEPYSGYRVGAALLSVSGKTFVSCNAETVSYTETDHAERSVITQAIAAGEMRVHGRKFIEAVAISHTGESDPCGGCRQRIAEHAQNCLVVVADENGTVRTVTSLAVLLPFAFTPQHLGKD